MSSSSPYDPHDSDVPEPEQDAAPDPDRAPEPADDAASEPAAGADADADATADTAAPIDTTLADVEPVAETSAASATTDTSAASTIDTSAAASAPAADATPGPVRRQHVVERPVPRSGLAEHHSAGFLTGDRDPNEMVPQPAGPPAADAEQPSDDADPTSVLPGTGVPEAPIPDTEATTATLLEGATVTPQRRSRAGAHWLGVLVALVLLPVAWYLLADAGARLTLPAGSPWQTGNLNIAALLELGGGLLVLAVALLAARWSSVGSIIAGSITIAVGVPFVAVPSWTQDFLAPALEWLRDLNDLGGNIAHHLVATGSTGRFIVYGVALVFLGLVSHGARRQGRRESDRRQG